MTVYNKLDEKVFASQAKPRETENFPNIARGWGISFEQTAGIPPMEWFNDLFKRIDEHILYLAQRGLAEWSSTLEYPQGAYVQYNGKTYRSLQQNTNQQPDAPDSAYWNRWGFALSEIPYATLSQKGLVQLYTGYDSQREDLALTPKTAYLLKALIDSNSRSLNNLIPNSKKSDSTTSNSSDTVATSKAAKTAYDKGVEAKTAADKAQQTANAKQSPATTLAGYGIANFKIEQGTGNANDFKVDGNYYFSSGQNLPDSNAWHIEVVSGGQTNAVRQIARKANDTKIKTRFFNGSSWTSWKDAGGDGVPLGAVVAFPRDIANPQGFLLADGSTFSQQTYPDLYRTLGNKNKLPNLKRSDVGMTSYFAVDNIPEGWIAFDSIRSVVNQQSYPELYQHLIAKYGSIGNVPLAEDRFIRSAHGSLAVGQKQNDELKSHTHYMPISSNPNRYDGTNFDNRNPVQTTSSNYEIEMSLGNGSDNHAIKPLHKIFYTGGAETRPKSIAFKLCIKAKNSFDEVRFWIKAFGEVTNVSALDASRLAQELQGKANANHTHTYSQITDFAQGVLRYLNQGFTQQLAQTGWTKLPNGLILQWGNVQKGYNHTTNHKITFPITFPKACLYVSLTEISDDWTHQTTIKGRATITRSGVEIISQRNDTMFLAIGN